MFGWIEMHPLATTVVGGLVVAFIIGLIKLFQKRFIEPTSSQNQTLKHSFIGHDVQQAKIILNNPSFQNSHGQKSTECKIKLAPFIDRIPPILNGGNFQGPFAGFHICFGSETNLELIDAAIFHESTMIRCESRDSKLEEGKNWNQFLFMSSKLPFTPDEIIFLRIRVGDHGGHCCELCHELQMKQFYPTINPGKNFGRWEIKTKGIFKIKCCENNLFEASVPPLNIETEISRIAEDWKSYVSEENDEVAKKIRENANEMQHRGIRIGDGLYNRKAGEILEEHEKNLVKRKKDFKRELENLGCGEDRIRQILV